MARLRTTYTHYFCRWASYKRELLLTIEAYVSERYHLTADKNFQTMICITYFRIPGNWNLMKLMTFTNASLPVIFSQESRLIMQDTIIGIHPSVFRLITPDWCIMYKIEYISIDRLIIYWLWVKLYTNLVIFCFPGFINVYINACLVAVIWLQSSFITDRIFFI